MKRREELDKYLDLSEEELQAEAARLKESLFRLEVQARAWRSGRGEANSPGEEIAGANSDACASTSTAGWLTKLRPGRG